MVVEATNSAPEPISMMPYSGFWIRLLAFIIDYGILGVVNYLMNLGLTAMGIRSQLVPLVVAIALGWMYFAVFEGSSWMGTPGKKALGLVVTDEQGRRITTGTAVSRGLLKIVLSNLPGIVLLVGYLLVRVIAAGQSMGGSGLIGLLIMAGCAWMIYKLAGDARKQGVHDKITHTLVLRKTS